MIVTAAVSVVALIVSTLSVRGLEGRGVDSATVNNTEKPDFRAALAQVWDEPVARRFTIFVFVSMLAYSAQDLILEPFAGAVHGYTPGASTQLAGVQHGGVLLGMLLVALSGALATRFPNHPLLRQLGSLRGWTVGGCVASALALFGLMLAGLQGADWPLKFNVFVLGVANGAFSIGAIGSMMRLAHEGGPARAGIRMGLWGAAQALAFGIGGLVGTGASDLAHHLLALPGSAYATVFALEGTVFLLSAVLAWRIASPSHTNPSAAIRRQTTPHSGAPLSAANHPRQA
jgi:BCD family chlorophyll transporter-like MFS transporter